MVILSLLGNIGWTTGIVLFVLLVLLLDKKYIEKKKDSISSKVIVIIYLVLFALIVASVVAISLLWGFDLTDFIEAQLNTIWNMTLNSIPKIIGTLIVLFVILTFYKIARIALHKLSRRPTANQRRKETMVKVTLSILKYLIVIFGVLIILSVWGVNVAPALAGLGIAGLVIGLGAQKFINDLISGFFIIFEHHFDVGDWVEINGFMGEVIDVGLKTTKVKNFKGEIKIFSNGQISPVSNFSQTNSLAIIDFGIAYKEDVKKTIEILTQELPKIREEQPNIIEDPRVLGVTNLDNSSVNLRVAASVVSMTQWGVERALRQRVKEILNAHNIEIPFPQVVIHDSKK